MHRIKKYANRKLYNVTTKRYVTMDDIADLVQSGEDITIVDNATGNDITQEIVSQLVGRVFDGQARKLPLKVLMQLMRKGSGGLVDYTRKYVSFWQNALNFAEDELDKVDTLIGREIPVDKGTDASRADGGLQDPDAMIKWLDERIDQRMEKVLQNKDLEINQQLIRLETGITKLTARIETFENIFSRVLPTGAGATSGQSGGLKKKAPEKQRK